MGKRRKWVEKVWSLEQWWALALGNALLPRSYAVHSGVRISKNFSLTLPPSSFTILPRLLDQMRSHQPGGSLESRKLAGFGWVHTWKQKVGWLAMLNLLKVSPFLSLHFVVLFVSRHVCNPLKASWILVLPTYTWFRHNLELSAHWYATFIIKYIHACSQLFSLHFLCRNFYFYANCLYLIHGVLNSGLSKSKDNCAHLFSKTKKRHVFSSSNYISTYLEVTNTSYVIKAD